MKANWIIFFVLFSVVVSAGEPRGTHGIPTDITMGSNPAGTPGGGSNRTRPVADDDPTKGPEAEDEDQAKKDAALKSYQRAQSDGVSALAEDFIAENKDLEKALEDYIQSDSEKLNPTDIKDKFKELTGKELSEEELARLLVAASSDQTKDKNDAFIARTIDSAWKKDPSQRTPIEKAMLERAKELMRGKEEVYRELSKQSGISDVRSAFRFRKLSQLVKDGKNDEAAKVAADWLLNMSPEARKKVAEIKGADLDVDDRHSGLKFLKAGAQYASESNTLRRAAISVSKEFSTAWGKNEQSAKTWAQDVKNLSPEDLRKKYGPELDTWLAQKAANGGGGEITQIALGKLTPKGTSASVTIRNTDALTGGAVTVEGPTASSVVSQVTNQGFTGLSDAATNQKGQLNALRSSERGLFDSTPGPDLSALIGGPKTLKTSDHPDIVRAVRDAATRLEMARDHQEKSNDPAIKALAVDTQAKIDAAKPLAASLGVGWEPWTPAPVPPQSQQAQAGSIQPAAAPAKPQPQRVDDARKVMRQYKATIEHLQLRNPDGSPTVRDERVQDLKDEFGPILGEDPGNLRITTPKGGGTYGDGTIAVTGEKGSYLINGAGAIAEVPRNPTFQQVVPGTNNLVTYGGPSSDKLYWNAQEVTIAREQTGARSNQAFRFTAPDGKSYRVFIKGHFGNAEITPIK